jgi:hypothetical protein
MIYRAFYLALARSGVCVPPALAAKLRSDENQANRPGSSLRADSLQPVRPLFGCRTCVISRQVDRWWDGGTAAIVPIGCGAAYMREVPPITRPSSR